MTDETIDPRHQEMIAALYGELSPDEDKAFHASLSKDATLRADWEELQATRVFLQRAKAAESIADTPFLAPTDAPGGFAQQAKVAPPPSSPLERLCGALRSPASGFALAAAASIILILAGLRVDRADGGLVLRFGSPHEQATMPTLAPAEGLSHGIPLEPARQRESLGAPSDYRATLPLTPADYVTRAEFAAFAHELMWMTDAKLHAGAQKRDRMALVARGLYETMALQQQRNRDALNAEMQQLWMGLLGMEKWRLGPLDSNNRQADGYQSDKYQVTPINHSAPNMKEEDQDD